MSAVYFHVRNWLEGTYTLRILDGFFALLWDLGPYMLVSIGIGVVATRIMRGRLTRWFTVRHEYHAIPVAAVLGLISPLPTYAAVPLGISLMSAGIPFSAVMTFCIASPLMNPSIFYLTMARLGMEMALVRTGTAFLMACAGGVLMASVFRSWSAGIPVPDHPASHGERALWVDIKRTSLYTLRVFGIAVFISAAVKALVPAQMIVDLAGDHAATGTLVAMGLGVPFYSCGGAAIPLVETLMDMGMGKGPVLAFFIAGPATKLETVYALRTAMGMKVVLFYLGLTVVSAAVAGSLYALF